MIYKECNEGLRKIENDIKKYYKSFFEYDYEKIIDTCINAYEKFAIDYKGDIQVQVFRDAICHWIIALAYYLDKDDLKKYIKILKLKKYYKVKGIKLLKYFLKPYIYMCLINEGNFNFVKKKSTKKKLQYYLDTHDKLSTILKKIFSNYLSLSYIELVITTKCTLRCKDCANLMHKYNKPYDVDINIIKKSIQKLLNCCNEIKMFRILGGEPFCNPNLKYILKELNSKKIKQIIIVTNGTIIPKDEELIECLKSNKIVVEISDYGKYSKKLQGLVNFCNNNNINYYSGNFIRLWQDYGEVKKYKNNINEQFFYCSINCKSILNGKLYYCPRLAHGIDLGLIKDNKNEYIDLINNNDKLNKKLLKKYIFRNFPISACSYCKYATPNSNIIPVAKQIDRGSK